MFVEKMFTAIQTSNAASFLLLNVLNDENFGEAIQLYGTDLIANAILAQ